MSDQYQKIKNEDLLKVIGWRGAVMHKAGSVLLELSVVITEEELPTPQKITLLLVPEAAEKVISSLQEALSILRQSN